MKRSVSLPPFLKFSRHVSLRHDLVAGLTVALVLIPQSMAYAQLAGLKAYYGLYAAFLPPLVAALFGSSRQLATGPVAICSLLTAVALEPLAIQGSEAYLAYAILLSLMAGFFQLGLGLLRLGVVVNFLSYPVINAYTNAAAIIIATSQLPKLFGVSVESTGYHFLTVWNTILEAVNHTHWPTLGLGALAFAVMFVLEKIDRRIPSVLIAVVLTALICWATGFERKTSVGLESIASPEAVACIKDVNAKMEQMDYEIQERYDLHAQRPPEKSFAEHDLIVAMENRRHEIALADVRIGVAKRESQDVRRKLRKFVFRRVETPGGKISFHIDGQVPLGVKGDGRSWRLSMANGALDESELTLTSGGAVVGGIPKGLPSLQWPAIDFSVAAQLIPMVIVISILGFVEAISIAKAMAARTGQHLDPNQELIGQGLAKVAGALTQSYPVSGSFSRSALNLNAGAVSSLSSVFTSLAVGITLLFFTPLLHHIPQAALAAVIMMAVLGLVNFRGALHAWQVGWHHGVAGMVTFVITLAFAPHLEYGMITGVVLSLGFYLCRRMRPTVELLSKHSDGTLRDSTRLNLKRCRHIALIEFEGSLFFANASFLEDLILDQIAENPDLKHIVIVGKAINDLDATGEDMLAQQVERLRQSGRDISITGVHESIRDIMDRTGLTGKFGEDHIFANVHQALAAIYEKAHEGSEEEDCPLGDVWNSNSGP